MDQTPTAMFTPVRAWWKSAVVYQIYPVSFFDSNGDGIGDLNGIFAKLDYLKNLGVDMLWLSPIYKSPQADMGYDVADYRDVDPTYGTLEDFDRLLKGAKDRGIKIVMDLVVNHTSDEHKWFVESISSKDSPKRDWYIWRPPKYDESGNRKPPNNWKSHFEGSAWKYDEPSGEYYLHLYHMKQPDLNWENENVRRAAYDIIKFWIDRGVEGFRMDVINKISKASGLPDAPIIDPNQEYQLGYMYYVNGPRVHEFIKEMHQEVLAENDLITIGETPLTHSLEEIAAYVLPQNKELNMVFQFELVDVDRNPEAPMEGARYNLNEFKNVITKWQMFKRDEGFWNTIFIENHDQPRSVTRFGDGSEKWRSLSAKVLAILQTTQAGTLFVYQGEELGMANFPCSWMIEEYKDVSSQNYYHRVLTERQQRNPDKDVDMSDVMTHLASKARDHARTPLQWNDSVHAGFTTGTPWMRINDDYATWNVSAQEKDDHSVLHFWRQALKLRKQHEVLIYGDFVNLLPDHEQIFAYTRNLDGVSALVVLNFSDKQAYVDIDTLDASPDLQYDLVLSNYGSDIKNNMKLEGWEGRIYIRRASQ